MSRLVRGNLVFAWLAVVSAALVFMAWTQAAAGRKVTTFDEITVHRINVVEPDGKPRVIISNRDAMAGIYWQGKEYRHSTRDAGGFLFFNDEGTEVGGMQFSNRKRGEGYSAGSSLLFDQYQNDQTLGLVYSEENGQRVAGMKVWDRPNASMLPLIQLSDRTAKATTDEERAQIKAETEALVKSYGPHPAAVRFFAGKELTDSIVKLSDQAGKPRLILKVSAAGEPSVEFLDATGKVVKRIGIE